MDHGQVIEALLVLAIAAINTRCLLTAAWTTPPPGHPPPRQTSGQARLFGAVFAVSSVLTPFFFGAVAGAIASGRVPATGRGDVWISWLNATSVFGGIIAVGACAFLAGTFLCADARRSGKQQLAEQLRWRTLAVGVVTGMVVFAALIPIQRDAPTLADGLAARAAPLIVASAIAGIATLVMVGIRRFAVARVTALIAVAAVVAGWGVGQYPWLLVDEVTITDAAGAPATLRALLVAVGPAAIIVLGYLYKLTQSEYWTRHPE